MISQDGRWIIQRFSLKWWQMLDHRVATLPWILQTRVFVCSMSLFVAPIISKMLLRYERLPMSFALNVHDQVNWVMQLSRNSHFFHISGYINFTPSQSHDKHVKLSIIFLTSVFQHLSAPRSDLARPQI